MADTNRIVSERSSADANIAADINELSNQALDKNGTSQLTNLTEDAAPASGSWFFMETAAGATRKVDTDNMPGSGGGSAGVAFLLRGNAYVGTKLTQVLIPANATISLVKIYADTAPTGASLIVDVNKNGVTIFTTQGNRPEIAIAGNSDDSGTPDVTSLAAGDRLSIDVDQVGSTVIGGNDLMITVVFS